MVRCPIRRYYRFSSRLLLTPVSIPNAKNDVDVYSTLSTRRLHTYHLAFEQNTDIVVLCTGRLSSYLNTPDILEFISPDYPASE